MQSNEVCVLCYPIVLLCVHKFQRSHLLWPLNVQIYHPDDLLITYLIVFCTDGSLVQVLEGGDLLPAYETTY